MELRTYLLCFFLWLPLTAWAFEDFDCVGSDPFWRLSITEKKITFTQQTSPPISLPGVEPKPAENMKIDHIRVFHTGVNNKDAFVIIQNQSCTDGKSDDVFSYEGLFIFNSKVFHGCCSKKILVTE